MWFARFVNGQRTKAKRVNETTFYALIQHFAIILFECKDCEDFLPARHLMSLCFTFFQEGKFNRKLKMSLLIALRLSLAVEVPGCDPYREYLFNYLRDQQIWHTLRFWNAAFFYALQKDKVPKAKIEKSRKCSSNLQLKEEEESEGKDALTNKETPKQPSRSISESSLSSSSSTDNTKTSESSKYKASSRKINRSKSSTNAGADDNTFDIDEKQSQDNMAFSHLG